MTQAEDDEAWTTTYTGVKFWPLAPRVPDIHIADLAHALALQCRFGGHCITHYSTAEHSVRTSRLIEVWGAAPAVQLWGLLHDAPEAYLTDVPGPVKRHPSYAHVRENEDRLMRAICDRFDMLPREQPRIVKQAEGVVFATEMRDLMRPNHDVRLTAEPLPERISPWSPVMAEQAFLHRFARLRQSG